MESPRLYHPTPGWIRGQTDCWDGGRLPPFFSPDGQRVGFITEDGKLKWVPIAGGSPQTICDLPVAGWSGGSEWQPDDTIYFSSRDPLAGGGVGRNTPTGDKAGREEGRNPRLLAADPARRQGSPLYGPNTTHGKLSHRVGIARNPRTIRLAAGASLCSVRVERSPDLRGSSGILHRTVIGLTAGKQVDPQRLTVTGPERQILDSVWVTGEGGAQFALSTTGTLVYALRGLWASENVGLVDRQGRPASIPAPGQRYNYPRLSPDEQFLSVSIVDGRRTDVWTYDLRRSGPCDLKSVR